MFPVSISDARLHPKRVIYSDDINGHPVAYTQSYLREKNTISDEVADKTLTVTCGEDGGVIVREAASGKSWVAHRLSWFAWYSFHPDTLLRKGIIDE